MTTSLLTPAQWAQTEFASAQLGDRRLTRRLVQMARCLAQTPTGTLPQAFPDWKDLKGAYRFQIGIRIGSTGRPTPHPTFGSNGPLPGANSHRHAAPGLPGLERPQRGLPLSDRNSHRLNWETDASPDVWFKWPVAWRKLPPARCPRPSRTGKTSKGPTAFWIIWSMARRRFSRPIGNRRWQPVGNPGSIC